jgi:hypothetical protein
MADVHCVSSATISHHKIQREAWNFGSNFPKIMECAVLNITKICVTTLRLALQHPTLPITFIKLSLQCFRNSWSEYSMRLWRHSVPPGLWYIRINQLKFYLQKSKQKQDLSKYRVKGALCEQLHTHTHTSVSTSRTQLKCLGPFRVDCPWNPPNLNCIIWREG